MTELALFASTFVLVFALGLQSLNVNNGHYWAAAFTSFFIGSSQLVLFKLAPNANWSEMAAFVAGWRGYSARNGQTLAPTSPTSKDLRPALTQELRRQHR